MTVPSTIATMIMWLSDRTRRFFMLLSGFCLSVSVLAGVAVYYDVVCADHIVLVLYGFVPRIIICFKFGCNT